jgi:hypothetical protein
MALSDIYLQRLLLVPPDALKSQTTHVSPSYMLGEVIAVVSTSCALEFVALEVNPGDPPGFYELRPGRENGRRCGGTNNRLSTTSPRPWHRHATWQIVDAAVLPPVECCPIGHVGCGCLAPCRLYCLRQVNCHRCRRGGVVTRDRLAVWPTLLPQQRARLLQHRDEPGDRLVGIVALPRPDRADVPRLDIQRQRVTPDTHRRG